MLIFGEPNPDELPVGWSKLHCLGCGNIFDIPDGEKYEAYEQLGINPSEADRCPKCKSDNVDFGH